MPGTISNTQCCNATYAKECKQLERILNSEKAEPKVVVDTDGNNVSGSADTLSAAEKKALVDLQGKISGTNSLVAVSETRNGKAAAVYDFDADNGANHNGDPHNPTYGGEGIAMDPVTGEQIGSITATDGKWVVTPGPGAPCA